MPLDLVNVERIDSVKTGSPWVLSHTITGETVEENPRCVQFQTIDQWKAAICDRARAKHQGVWITWKDGRFRTKELIAVTLDTTKFQEDAR